MIELKDTVRSRVDHRIKTSDAVVIATLLDPSTRLIVERSHDEIMALLCARTKAAVEFKNFEVGQQC